MDTIRATYFRNHEILYPDLADYLDSCRNGVRTVLSLFEAEKERRRFLAAALRLSASPAGRRASAPPMRTIPGVKRIKARIARTGARMVKELLLQSRFEALAFIGEKDAAQAMLDQGLDELLS